jgi:hypothetical protein
MDGFIASGFLVLARDADEIVIGGIGRFWRQRGGGLMRLADPEHVRVDDRAVDLTAGRRLDEVLELDQDVNQRIDGVAPIEFADHHGREVTLEPLGE